MQGSGRLFDESSLSCFALRFDQSGISGWGIFADEWIPPHAAIVEYIGEIVQLDTVLCRQKVSDAKGNFTTYVFRLDDGDHSIDATARGALRASSTTAATRTARRGPDGAPHVVIYAKRWIGPCEELSYDSLLPWEPREKAIPCKCGAQQCRGWLKWKGTDDAAAQGRPDLALPGGAEGSTTRRRSRSCGTS
jgi:SET domain-containing protein